MLILQIVAILILSLILVKAADHVIIATRRVAKESGVGAITLVALILALATSLPELFVGIVSAFSGTPNLSLGNLIGANIVNLGVVTALSGLLAGGIAVRSRELLKEDMPLALIAGVAPIVLLWNRELSRLDGLLLLLLYGAYASGFYHSRFVEIGRVHQEEGFWHKLVRSVETGNGVIRHEVARFFIGVAVMVGVAYLLVIISTQVAQELAVPVFIIGLLLLSLGTTLPELVFAIRSIKQKAMTLVVANTLGSVIVNSTLIVGVVALIHPIHIVARGEYLLATTAFSLLMILFWFFVGSKERLTRLESVVLLIVYIIFVALEISGFKFF